TIASGASFARRTAGQSRTTPRITTGASRPRMPRNAAASTPWYSAIGFIGAPLPGRRGSPQLLRDDPRIALERPVRPGPVDHDDDAVPEIDEEVDVRPEPHEPGGEAREPQPAEIGDRGLAPDGRELPVVAIAE